MKGEVLARRCGEVEALPISPTLTPTLSSTLTPKLLADEIPTFALVLAHASTPLRPMLSHSLPSPLLPFHFLAIYAHPLSPTLLGVGESVAA